MKMPAIHDAFHIRARLARRKRLFSSSLLRHTIMRKRDKLSFDITLMGANMQISHRLLLAVTFTLSVL